MAIRYTIDDMQEYAAKHGGKCISKEYVSTTAPLKWKCAKGHTWYAVFQTIKQGGWCPACFREDEKRERASKRKEKYLLLTRELARVKGSECLADKFESKNGHMPFRCTRGHDWISSYQMIRQGAMCPQCYLIESRAASLKALKRVVKKNKGVCESDNYINNRTKMPFCCAEGHRFTMIPNSVMSGQWCPICRQKGAAEKRKYPIKVFQKIAFKKGGRLVSDKYITIEEKLLWECSEGHQWYANGASIMYSDTWCPYCRGMYKTIDDMHALAAERGGKCLSKKYVKASTKLTWQCNKGHIWKAVPTSIQRSNSWCPVCANKSRAEKQKDSIEIFRKIAIDRGGRLLSDTYINNVTKLFWECSKGHQWYAMGVTVKNAGTWCPYCAGHHKTMADMHALAAKRDGKCLSKKYVNSTTKLKWQCSKGHIWKTAPVNVASNNWCPVCGKESSRLSRKHTIEIYQKIAAERGGRLLSETYTDSHTKLLWGCKKGHQWEAQPCSIKNSKSWCPYCAGQR